MDLIIRQYKSTDCRTISRLFYETVHSVNAKDYSPEQLFAWAKDTDRLQARREDLLRQNTLVAQIGKNTVGVGSIDKSGYLDLLYVHKDYQRRGIATALCDRLEQDFTVVTTHASITAKSFFENRGYEVINEQEVERLGVKLKNYVMQKNMNT